MSNPKTEFYKETLDTIADLYVEARPYADALVVDPFLAIGGPAEELDTINKFPAWKRGADRFLDFWTAGYPHSAIEGNIASSQRVDQTHGVSVADKFSNPVLVDVGIGNIKLLTAIELLKEYNRKYPQSDPFDLKKYNEDYSRLVTDLSSRRDLETTAKFAVLHATEAIDFFRSRAPKVWANASHIDRLGLVATYYNRGREKMHQVATQAERFGEYQPVPGYGGEKAADNGQALRSTISARRKREIADLRVPVGTVSSARLPGQHGTIPIGTETNTLDVVGESGLLRNFPASMMPRADPGTGGRGLDPIRNQRGYERRSQADPSAPGGLLGPTFTRFAADANARPAEVAPNRFADQTPTDPFAAALREPAASRERYAVRPIGGRMPPATPFWQRPVSALDAYLMERELDELDASPVNSFADARQGAAASRGQGGAVSTARSRTRSTVPHWQRPVSALDANLMEPPPEEPDIPRTEIVAPVPIAAVRLAGGLLGDRFADLARDAARRRPR